MNQPFSPHSAALPLAEECGVSLDDVLRGEPAAAARPAATRPLPAVIVGTLSGISEEGRPLVDFDGNPAGRALPARSTASVDAAAIGCAVALLFEEGDPGRPIILGMIQPAAVPAGVTSKPNQESEPAVPSFPAVEAAADGQRLTISADNEIELRCGKASITLTRAGKVIIRGAYLLSRSSGVNRIKGGSVQIN